MGIRDTFMKVFREALDESVTEVVDEYKRNGTLYNGTLVKTITRDFYNESGGCCRCFQ